MKRYIEVKSSTRLPIILPKRRKFLVYRYDDGSVELELGIADAEEPHQYWLEEIKDGLGPLKPKFG